MTKRTITLDESHETADLVVEAEPLTVELDELELAKGPAAAIAKAVSDDIAAITASAKGSTVLRRRSRGITSTRLFNATGTLARGVRAVAAGDGDGFAIAAPPDRLEDSGMAARLVGLVPALRDPLADPAVKAAIEKADQLTAQVGKGGRR